MKAIKFLLLLTLTGCMTTGEVKEGEIHKTRTYIGNYESFQHRKPEKWTEPNLCWIKTNKNTIIVYAKEIKFVKGEFLYIRETSHYIPGSMVKFRQKQVESENSKYFYKIY